MYIVFTSFLVLKLQTNFDIYYKAVSFDINPEYGYGWIKLINKKLFTVRGASKKDINNLVVGKT